MKIAIVGTAPTSKMLAPYDDKSWHIWACSAGNVNALPRVNIWFEMHAIVEMMAPENRAMATPFFAWLKEKSDADVFEVVMLEFNQYVPKAIPYPRDEMIEKFGRNWFTSSVAYMMALAIARGATEIGLFGVDMAADQEHYSGQRAGCTWFIEKAESLGITVHVPPESCLKTAVPMYGYSEGTHFHRRINATILQVQAALNNANAQIAASRDQANYFGGALEQLRYFQRTWVDGADMAIDLSKLDEIKERAGLVAAQPVPTAPSVYETETVVAVPLAPVAYETTAAAQLVTDLPAFKLNGSGALRAPLHDQEA